jgi:uncharacterized membrane protein YdbT with pleckstrin-like domain
MAKEGMGLQMSNTASDSVVWFGKPWILPSAVIRSVVTFIIVALAVSLEFMFGVALDSVPDVPVISGVPFVWWTVLIFLLIWVFSLLPLLLLKATHAYVLHNDSLEIRTGVATERSFVISPSGFSDLEVIRSVFGRLVDSGDIIVRTQSETDSEKRMVKIRAPLKVADQIRHAMGRPIVRIEGQQPPTTQEKK